MCHNGCPTLTVAHVLLLLADNALSLHACLLTNTTGILAQALVGGVRQLFRSESGPGDPKQSWDQLYCAQRVHGQ